jgi:hypothetical protein
MTNCKTFSKFIRAFRFITYYQDNPAYYSFIKSKIITVNKSYY